MFTGIVLSVIVYLSKLIDYLEKTIANIDGHIARGSGVENVRKVAKNLRLVRNVFLGTLPATLFSFVCAFVVPLYTLYLMPLFLLAYINVVAVTQAFIVLQSARTKALRAMAKLCCPSGPNGVPSAQVANSVRVTADHSSVP